MKRLDMKCFFQSLPTYTCIPSVVQHTIKDFGEALPEGGDLPTILGDCNGNEIAMVSDLEVMASSP